MKKNDKREPDKSMEELQKFYTQKKKEQEALKNLLKALDEKSKKETNGNHL